MASAAVFDLALLRQVEDLAFRPRSNEALVKMQQLFANVKSMTKSWVATCFDSLFVSPSFSSPSSLSALSKLD